MSFLRSFSQPPPSLFHQGFLRKTTKNAHLIREGVSKKAFPDSGSVILDGGLIRHAIKWPEDTPYSTISSHYVYCAMRNSVNKR